ncbi:MAG: hypothetical protein JJ913_06935 [Rhizobiaceae bacterium]|nr:hypothetical protein [Rhizobiaceae bacterium]
MRAIGRQALKCAVIAFAALAAVGARAEQSCPDLNRAYVERYVPDFHIDPAPHFFDIDLDTHDNFRCDGRDRNHLLARAIGDLDSWRPFEDEQTDFYDMLKLILSLGENAIRYTSSLDKDGAGTRTEAQVFFDENDPSRSAVFLTDNFFSNGKRLRPTYSLVHEARHTIKHKLLPDGRALPDEPGHVVCTRGLHAGRGRKVCDAVLDFEAQMAFGSGNSYEFMFLVFVRDHPQVPQPIKDEAQQHLSYLATHMFNEIVPGTLEHYGVELIPKADW